MIDNSSQFLHNLFTRAIEVAKPAYCLPRHLPPSPKGKTIVIGAGKSTAAMAATFEKYWTTPVSGLVITRYGHSVKCRDIEVVEAGHPIPDNNGLHATQQLLSYVQNLTPDDLVVCLLSGGGSALLTLPPPQVPLTEKQNITKQLLHCGAPIREINTVRKHISVVKGGRLGLACSPASVYTLIISDAPCDDLSIIASGPTYPDPTTTQDAHHILNKYNIPIPHNLLQYWNLQDETPKPNDPRLNHVQHVIIATAQDVLNKASEISLQYNITPMILGDSLEGEARNVAQVMAGIVRQIVRYGQPLPPPCLLLSGGETSVTVRSYTGKGGRNTEFLLALAIELQALPHITALACDTDGIDGTENNAGAIITPHTLHKANQLDINPTTMLHQNNAYPFFHALNDLVITGPTLTNVNDFRAILINTPQQ